MQVSDTITIIQCDEHLELLDYDNDTGETSGAILRLNLETGHMVVYAMPRHDGMTEISVLKGRTLEFTFPVVTAAEANELMTDLLPLATRVLAGARIDWDGSNFRGHLDADAQRAEDEIETRLEQQSDTIGVTVAHIDASGGDDEDFGVTANTTDDELEAIATEWEQAAGREVDGVTYYLFGAWEYLDNLRDEAIAEAAA